MSKRVQTQQFRFSFAEEFLKLHAGQIVTDQGFAIVELIANCWDAGATRVDVNWPESGGLLSIHDNGIGMTKDELLYRWGKFNYNRIEEQGGKEAIFPKNASHGQRLVFGRNGVGRHAIFCFSPTYEIKTTKDDEFTHARVARLANQDKPFDVVLVATKKIKNSESGTVISTTIDKDDRALLSPEKVVELIGSRFISDPQFLVNVNGHRVVMTDLSHITETFNIKHKGGFITIKRILGEKGRNTKQNGIAWWYNNRLVGNPNWESFHGHLVDGRHPIAKKVLYIITADGIDPRHVKKDWSGFHMTEEVLDFMTSVQDFIKDDLRNLLYETRKERRIHVYETNKKELSQLSSESKEKIVTFLDEVQSKCPTIGVEELEIAVEVLAKMEKARSGYSLLEKLSSFDPREIDELNEILEQWSVDDAKKVLGELRWRLELIKKLEAIVENHKADELHDLQPLFEHGLWIFGPEFESISFMSNRSLTTVVRSLFGEQVLDNGSKRPDFVILEHSSIGIYSSDSFDDNHEMNEFNKVVVVELKRAGVPIDLIQKDQALRYARELRKSRKVSVNTPIIAYVLGSEILPEAIDEFIEGPIKIIPFRYNVILSKAHYRTFNLMSKIQEIKQIEFATEMDEIVSTAQMNL
jgi:hypothetical protein